jgi:late competence protein required for DNA uptake (superfamily II DNA/RNA helicase)
MIEKTIHNVSEGLLEVDSIPYRDAVNLYYVACSRARKSLINATALSATPKLV